MESLIFLGNHEFVLTQENVLFLRKCMLKYLGMKCHHTTSKWLGKMRVYKIDVQDGINAEEQLANLREQ